MIRCVFTFPMDEFIYTPQIPSGNEGFVFADKSSTWRADDTYILWLGWMDGWMDATVNTFVDDLSLIPY